MKVELYNDHFQNFKRYNIQKAQLVIADIHSSRIFEGVNRNSFAGTEDRRY